MSRPSQPPSMIIHLLQRLTTAKKADYRQALKCRQDMKNTVLAADNSRGVQMYMIKTNGERTKEK
jgi:hypothetical protein